MPDLVACSLFSPLSHTWYWTC